MLGVPALHLLTTAQRANNGNKPNRPLPWEIDLYWLLLPLHRPTGLVSGRFKCGRAFMDMDAIDLSDITQTRGEATTTVAAKMEFVFEEQRSWIVV